MRTKEEILFQEINEHPFQGLGEEECKIAYKAMDSYAEEVAIDFGEYVWQNADELIFSDFNEVFEKYIKSKQQ